MPVGLSNLPRMVKSGLDLYKKPNFYLVSATIILGFPNSPLNDTLGNIFTPPHCTGDHRAREVGWLSGITQPGRASQQACPIAEPRFSHTP